MIFVCLILLYRSFGVGLSETNNEFDFASMNFAAIFSNVKKYYYCTYPEIFVAYFVGIKFMQCVYHDYRLRSVACHAAC